MKTILREIRSALAELFKSTAQTLATAFLTLVCSHEPKVTRQKNTRWHKFLIDNHFATSEKVAFSVEPKTNVLCVCVMDDKGREHNLYFKIVEDGPDPLHFIAEEVDRNHRFKNEAHLCDFLHKMIAHPQLIDGPIFINHG